MIICLKASKSVKLSICDLFMSIHPHSSQVNILKRNSHWFAAIPAVCNKHTASARLYQLFNVFCLLGKAPGNWSRLMLVCKVILIVIFPFFTILIIFLTWWKHLENDFWQLMVQTIVIDRMPQGQSTISVPLLFYSDANWLLLSTTHLWGVRWESAQLGLPCLGTTAITTKIAPGRSGLSPGVQKPDEPQRSGSNRTLCGDTFNWCAP